jgi:hypothetical protein
VTAGEIDYVPPAHVFEVLEDAETVEFSPTIAYREHMNRVAANVARAHTDSA